MDNVTLIEDIIKQGKKFVRYNQYEKAKEKYLEALKIDTGYSEVYRELGKVYYLEENYNKAINMYLSAIHIDLHDLRFGTKENKNTVNKIKNIYKNLDEEKKVQLPYELASFIYIDYETTENIGECFLKLLSNKNKKEKHEEQVSLFDVGVEFIINNLKWKAINNIDIRSLYLNNNDKSKKYINYVKTINNDHLKELVSNQYDLLCKDVGYRGGFGKDTVSVFISSVLLLDFVEDEKNKILKGIMKMTIKGDVSPIDFRKFVEYFISEKLDIDVSYFISAYMYIEKTKFDIIKTLECSNEDFIKENGYTPLELLRIVGRDIKYSEGKITVAREREKKEVKITKNNKSKYYKLGIASIAAAAIMITITNFNNSELKQQTVVSDATNEESEENNIKDKVNVSQEKIEEPIKEEIDKNKSIEEDTKLENENISKEPAITYYSIYCGAFKDENKAKERVKEIKKFNLDANIVMEDGFFKVKIFTVSSIKEANLKIKELKNITSLNSYFLGYNSDVEDNIEYIKVLINENKKDEAKKEINNILKQIGSKNVFARYKNQLLELLETME